MSYLRAAALTSGVLLAAGFLASCGGESPRPLPPASEIVFQGTVDPVTPFPETLLQEGDLPAEPVATIWPYITPSPMRTWTCPRVAPGALADGDPVRATYDIGGDLVTTAYYPDDSIWDELFPEMQDDWRECAEEVAERGHPDATSTIDLGEDTFGYVSRRADGTVEGEEGFALVDGDIVAVGVISYGGRAPNVSVEELLPVAVERARSGR
ncbi:hypothetical protein ACHAAC_06240 [Aeromicrobium sp. CF4.19]|uniref:hypothetical protein n=1 Tax=Aeromicrobium sp. CF4.19 TaxID=3373082 RepID=UPI003EE75B1D